MPTPTAKLQRPVRQGAWLSYVLLALPLLSLAAVWLVAWSYRPPPPNTGDPLLDALFQDFDHRGGLPWQSAYLAACDSNDLWRVYAEIGNNPDFPLRKVVQRPASVLDHLDERFTRDPRYWLMLYFAKRYDPRAAAAAEVTARGMKPEVWFLEEAERRGATSTTLLSYLLQQQSSAWIAAQPSVPFDTTQSRAKPKHWQPEFWQEDAHNYRLVSGKRLDKLLEELLAVGASDAAAHYEAALYEGRRGNLARAQELLAEGNALPQCSTLGPYFDSAGQWDASRLPRQTWPIEDMAFGSHYARLSMFTLQWDRLLRVLAFNAVQHNDRSALQDLHLFICRYATNPESMLLSTLVARNLSNTPSSALKELAPATLDTHDLQGLGQLYAARDIVSKACSTYGKQHRHNSNPLHDWRRRALVTTESWLSCGITNPVTLLKLEHQDEVSENEDCQRIFTPLWADLARFDYRTMQFTPEPPPSR